MASVISTSAKVKAFNLLVAPPPEIKVYFFHKYYTFLNSIRNKIYIVIIANFLGYFKGHKIKAFL